MLLTIDAYHNCEAKQRTTLRYIYTTIPISSLALNLDIIPNTLMFQSKRGLYIAFLHSLLALSCSFHLPATHKSPKKICFAQKNISGSFFNPVPNRDDEEEGNISESSNASSPSHLKEVTPGTILNSFSVMPRMDPFDQSLEDLKRKKTGSNPKSSPIDQSDTPSKTLGRMNF